MAFFYKEIVHAFCELSRRHSGEGLVVTHAPHAGERGFYVKVGDKTYHKGSGLLHGLFGKFHC